MNSFINDIFATTHSFSIPLATLLKSADQAIFLHHINYWIQYNARTEKNFHDGHYWMYDNLDDLHGHFPYWSLKQLRLIIEKLVEKEIVIKGNYNNSTYDRTAWYTIDYEKVKCICLNGQMEKPERANRFAQKGTPIPHNIPHNIEKEKKVYKEKKEQIPKISFGSHVLLTQEEYEKLCKENTKEKVDNFINEINDWCEMHGEKYTGYAAAIRKWIRNENQFKPLHSSKNQAKIENQETNISLANTYEKTLISQNFTINVLSKHIEIVPKGNGQPICINYSELGFKEQVENALRKCGFRKKENKI